MQTIVSKLAKLHKNAKPTKNGEINTRQKQLPLQLNPTEHAIQGLCSHQLFANDMAAFYVLCANKR